MVHGSVAFCSCWSIIFVVCIVVLIPAGAVSTELGEKYIISPGNRGGSTDRSSSLIIVTTPRTSFTFTQDGNVVTFTDTSTRNPTSWYWTFGDKKSSREQNPSHSYTKRGTYTVTLTADNSAGSSSTSATIVIGSLPWAKVTYTQNGKTIAFKDASTRNPTTWFWSFGDGTTSTAQNPSHSYAENGTYTVTLTAGNSARSTSTSTAVIMIP